MTHVQFLQPRQRRRHLPSYLIPRQIQLLHRLYDPKLLQTELQLVPRRPEPDQIICLIQQPHRTSSYIVLSQVDVIVIVRRLRLPVVQTHRDPASGQLERVDDRR